MKVVLCHGVFDLLHEGHLEHLEQARKFGDHLVISVVADKYAIKRKPIYKEKARVRLLRALRCVTQVRLCHAPGPEKIIMTLHPDVYVRGSDYIGKSMPESGLLQILGIPVRYTHSSFPRTTELIEKIRRGSK